ncbi:MAG: hypothetical protein VW270_00475 [Candidatus Poseidoniales archaeon]
MDKVLVIKQQDRISAQYPVGAGGPVLVLGGGGDQRGARGRTLRERLGSAAGKIFGALVPVVTGKHHSLGGAVQSAISGAAQGGAIGAGLGRATVGRVGQERANIREAERQARAQADAQLAEQTRSRGRGTLSRLNPAAALRRYNVKVADEEEQRRDFINMQNRAAEQSRQQASDYGAGKVAVQRKKEERLKDIEDKAMSRAMGAEVGVNRREKLADIERFEERTGGDISRTLPVLATYARSPEFQTYQDRMAAFQAIEDVNVDKPTDAAGNLVQVIGPNNPVSMPPPDGSVGSKNESADPNAQVLNETGFNTVTENEPSDNMKPQQEGGDSALTDEDKRAIELFQMVQQQKRNRMAGNEGQ